MKDKLVKEIENHCKDFGEKIKNIKNSYHEGSRAIDEKIDVKLSDDLNNSDLDVNEKMRLQRLLDKSYNKAHGLYWTTNLDTNYDYLEDLRDLVTSSNIKEDKKEKILDDLENCIESMDNDYEENEFYAIENAQAGLHEVGVDYHNILNKLESERLDRINANND